uniref:Nuclear receptor domain-containing protein n=1 Tax=Panagrolaimus sp. PS1159 TaxID=55785 RepID=A0AC35FNC7_9BILA
MKKAAQLPEKSAEPCLVCGMPTSTLNLQLNACRVCASFFRRYLTIFQSYCCHKNKGSCDITIKSKH